VAPAGFRCRKTGVGSDATVREFAAVIGGIGEIATSRD
jgi:hypothetical protein